MGLPVCPFPKVDRMRMVKGKGALSLMAVRAIGC